MMLPGRTCSYSSSNELASHRLTTGSDYSGAACRHHSFAARATPSSDRRYLGAVGSAVESSASQSSAASPTSTSSTLGGWSEDSSVLSPDTGRQYLQLLTQTKPSVMQRRTYHLIVKQHPRTAAEFGLHDMSRIPLAPPLFVQLVVRDSLGAEVSADAELPFLVARITLHPVQSPHKQDLSSTSQLYGTTISAPHSIRDRDGVPGAYFIFPDVGVRQRGQWKLHVSLLQIPHMGSATVSNGDTSTCLAGVWTDPFDVVPAEGYVAPQVTPLTRHFQSQGVRMFISNSVVPR